MGLERVLTRAWGSTRPQSGQVREPSSRLIFPFIGILLSSRVFALANGRPLRLPTGIRPHPKGDVMPATAFEFPAGLPWLNAVNPLTSAALSGRVTVLHFFACGQIAALDPLADLSGPAERLGRASGRGRRALPAVPGRARPRAPAPEPLPPGLPPARGPRPRLRRGQGLRHYRPAGPGGAGAGWQHQGQGRGCGCRGGAGRDRRGPGRGACRAGAPAREPGGGRDRPGSDLLSRGPAGLKRAGAVPGRHRQPPAGWA